MKYISNVLFSFLIFMGFCEAQEFAIFKDLRNAKEYKSVIIGEQEWMAENLNVDRFKNGDLILNAKTADEWIKAGENKIPAWCYYKNNSNYGPKYGRMYNWYAVIDKRGLAPEGWTIPTEQDFNGLSNKFGGEQKAGSALKNSNGWMDAQSNGTNKSGFSALPGGERMFYGETFGEFVGVGGSAQFWTSSEDVNDENSAFSFLLNFQTLAGNSSSDKGAGFYVRCVKK